MQLATLRYFIERWKSAGLEDRAYALDITCHKCNDLRLNYRRSELEMYNSYTQRLLKLSHQLQDRYTDIEWK